VTNPAIQKDPAWIEDIAKPFAPDAKLLQITKNYASANKGVDENDLFSTFARLRKIINNHVGVIELAEELDIETVTEIFIRVNSAGATLSQADFAMSKIAANDKYDGSTLRKAIDYFCHLAVSPDFGNMIEKNDPAFRIRVLVKAQMASTTLADLFMLRLCTDPPSAVRATLRW